MASSMPDRERLATPSDTDKAGRQFPAHPIPQLQGPFDESILEANEGAGDKWVVDIDAQCRRRDLLENSGYERLCGRKWRQRPGERYHPLWKLTSMMSFGIYLLAKGLAKGLAKSEVEVLRTLQNYVDELDKFIERSKGDFLIIQIDVRTRIQYLSLPLGNLDVFDEMLEDRNFRLAMIDYNEKIEYAIERFSAAVRDSIHDVQKGREAISALWHYIGRLGQRSDRLSENLNTICKAMIANIEGWDKAFRKLHKRGTALDAALFELGMAVVEMQRRVGVASRKGVVSFAKPPNKRSQVKSVAGRLLENNRPITVSSCRASDKPLPSDPVPLDAVRQRSAPGDSKSPRITTKSVPNLRTIKESHNNEEAEDIDNHQPFSDADEGVEPNRPVPKAERNLARRLFKPAQKELVSKRSEGTYTRPATAPSRTLKGRSASLEHLKSLCSGRKSQQQATMSKSPDFPARQTVNPATRRDTLKNQVLHYLTSDNVNEAWEATVRKEGKASRRYPQKKMDWPLSIFRARASNNGCAPGEPDPGLLKNGLGGQMTWLQDESETLNTYSLKPKLDISPRLHALSAQQAITKCLGEAHSSGDENTEAETESMITALPAVPHPPVNELDSLNLVRDSGHGQASGDFPQSASSSS